MTSAPEGIGKGMKVSDDERRRGPRVPSTSRRPRTELGPEGIGKGIKVSDESDVEGHGAKYLKATEDSCAPRASARA